MSRPLVLPRELGLGGERDRSGQASHTVANACASVRGFVTTTCPLLVPRPPLAPCIKIELTNIPFGVHCSPFCHSQCWVTLISGVKHPMLQRSPCAHPAATRYPQPSQSHTPWALGWAQRQPLSGQGRGQRTQPRPEVHSSASVCTGKWDAAGSAHLSNPCRAFPTHTMPQFPHLA